MLTLYPLFINLAGRRCVVVGGGSVAERKIGGLLDTGACIVVVSPVVTPTIQRWMADGSVTWIARPYQSGDLLGAFFVIAATDVAEVNDQVVSDAQAAGILVCSADKPIKGNVTMPAIIRRGPLTIAISTAGQAPAFARFVREDLDALIPSEYTDVVDRLAEWRRELFRRVAEPVRRTQIWRTARRAGLIDLFVHGQDAEAYQLLVDLIGSGSADTAGEHGR